MAEREEDSTSEDRLRRVEEHWGRTARSRRESSLRGWLDSYAVASERLNAPVTGDPNLNWLVGLARRLGIEPSSRWLSVGCGSAGQEIGSAREGLFASLDAVDLSRSALDEARRAAAGEGVDNITFRQVDFNRFEPPADHYDVVLMNMSLHHVEDLETLLPRIAACLDPAGFLVINEYVGPRQFQFGDRQLGIVRELLAVLPEELRQDVTTGKTKTAYERRPVEFWNVVDPSESVRSDEIPQVLERYFDVVERIDYGGAVLHLLLEHIIHNFDNGNPHHVAILRLLGKLEDALVAGGVLASDFTVMALRRKDAPPPVLEAGSAPAHAASSASDSELELLRAELTRAYSYIWEIETSRGWKLLERLRKLLGRGWRKG